MAHELNNPLASVIGFSELMMAEDLPQQAQDDIKKVHSDAQRAARVVQNLLSFARRHEPAKQYGDISSVVEKALDLKAHDFRANNIQVRTKMSGEVPFTVLDEHQMLQVVMNILTNAEQAVTERPSRVPGSGVRRGGVWSKRDHRVILSGQNRSSRKEDNGGQGKDGPAGVVAQGGNGR